MPGCRGVNHSKITVSTILQHLAHHSERNPGEGDQPLVRSHLVIFKTFSEPKPVDVGEELRVLVGRTLGVPCVGVEVDKGPVMVSVKNLAYPLDGGPVAGDIVHVEPVQPVILFHPAQSLKEVVDVAGLAHEMYRGVRIPGAETVQRSVPLRDIILYQVLTQPGVPFTMSFPHDLVTQAVKSVDLLAVGGQLPHGVVQLDLTALLVLMIDERDQGVTYDEWIVDVGVEVLGVMDVRYVGPVLGGLVEVLWIRMEELHGELFGGVDRFCRCDGQVELKIDRFFPDRSFSGRGHDCGFLPFGPGDRDISLS